PIGLVCAVAGSTLHSLPVVAEDSHRLPSQPNAMPKSRESYWPTPWPARPRLPTAVATPLLLSRRRSSLRVSETAYNEPSSDRLRPVTSLTEFTPMRPFDPTSLA